LKKWALTTSKAWKEFEAITERIENEEIDFMTWEDADA
jgi:hypothetical protein